MGAKTACMALCTAVGCQGSYHAPHSADGPGATVSVPQPEVSPEPDDAPAPSPGCEAFPPNLARYRIEADEDSVELEVGALVDLEPLGAGAADSEPVLARVVAAEDANSDHRADYILSLGSLQAGDFVADCGNYGHCMVGLFVSCGGDRLVEMIRAAYRTSLEFADSWTELDGVRWRDLIQEERRATSQLEEADLMDRGEPLSYRIVWRQSPEGYCARRPDRP